MRVQRGDYKTTNGDKEQTVELRKEKPGDPVWGLGGRARGEGPAVQ